MTEGSPTVVHLVRAGVLDAELAALVWLLAGARVPVHVASPDPAEVARVGAAIEELAADPGAVTTGRGARLEDVIRLPVPMRPATGAVLVLGDGRIAAAHLLRPPLRDVGGHVRPQPPAVLAAWEPREGRWEHFAWALAPEIGDATGRPAGDVEIDLGRRREYLDDLAAARLDDDVVRAALAGYGARQISA